MKLRVFINESVYDKGLFKAIFLVGSPGSGKSFFRNKVLRGPIEMKVVNPDIFIEKISTKKGLSLDYKSRVQGSKELKVFKKAREKVVPRQQTIWINNRLPLIFDRTGSDYNETSEIIKMLKKIGYDVLMILIKADLETTKKRMKSRERKVEPDYQEYSYKKIQENIPKYRSVLGKNFILVDNSGEFNKTKEQEWNKQWKNIRGFLNSAPSSPKAKEWIANELEKKRRNK